MKTTNQGASTKNNTSAKKIAFAAIIAAIYAALTVLFQWSSFTATQFRVAEGLTILPYFSPYAIPGLFVGCLISNIISPVGTPDLIIGSLASLAAAVLTYYIGKSNLKYKKYLAPLPPVIINAVVIGVMLKVFYAEFIPIPLYLCMLQVGLGQLVCCYGLGIPLMNVIEKNPVLKKYLS